MSAEQSKVNAELDLERCMAAEAVFSFERYLAMGVAPESYAFEHTGAVVRAAHASWDADGAVNLGTVARELQRAGKLDAIGGQTGLAELLTLTHAVPDPDRLRELHRLRRVRDAAVAVALKAGQGDLHGALALLSEAQSTAIDLASTQQPRDAVELGYGLVEQLMQKTRAHQLVHPGLDLMQRAMGDLPIGSMMVLGGGTNTGKSSVCLEMLMGAAMRNVTCGYVSCEDPESVLSSRLMSARSGISSRKLAQGVLHSDDWPSLEAATFGLDELKKKLWFAFTVGGNEVDVCAAMSKLALLGCRLIVVDYIQAIESSKRQQDRRNEIRWLSARVKAHAQRLDIALVLVSQLSRPAKGDEFREPTKHDLKEAGDLENAAEFVVLIWRGASDDSAPLEIKLDKSKWGNIGARWKMARGAGMRLREVEGSYRTAAEARDEKDSSR